MGFFSSIREAAALASDEVQSDLLLKEVQSAFADLLTFPARERGRTMYGFLQIKEKTLSQLPNMSLDGKQKLAKLMKRQAKAAYDHDISGSTAKWLVGAWMDSNRLIHPSAFEARELIEAFEQECLEATTYAESQLEAEDCHRSLPSLDD